MFPFIIKGKVPLGLRRNYPLSETGLQERIAERLIVTDRKSESRTDGSPSGDGRGLVAGGIARLRNMGFLTVIRMKNIRIISREDLIFAGYEMDATVSTLVSMVVIPLVLGSVLFSHSAFSFYEALAILVLLVLTSWGLDVIILVMLVRHEIYQIAAEIRAIMINRDARKIDIHHQDLSPEDLLATAYYYERNGLVRRCEAYLVHLIAWHPGSFEAVLARDHMEHLDGIPGRRSPARTREGQRKRMPAPRGKWSRIKNMASPHNRRGDAGTTERDENGKIHGYKKGKNGLLKLAVFPGRKKNGETSHGATKSRSKEDSSDAPKDRMRLFFGKRVHGKPPERTVRKRRERLARREELSRSPDEKSLTRSARMKLRLSRFARLESKEERLYRKERERWFHGPRPPKQAVKRDRNTNNRRQRRPNWMRSREDRQAIERQRRWSEGLTGPGNTQKSRDRWGKWRLLSGESRAQRQMKERQAQAVKEPQHA